MIIKSIHVRNFRCLLDTTLDCDRLTALVGPNGSGKSSFLRALEVFYAPSPALEVEDFYAQDTDQPIEITITFTALDAEELERFQGYVENGDLTVTRVCTLAEGRTKAKYHGSRLQHPSFAAVREIEGARQLRAAYEGLRQQNGFTGLAPVQSKEAALEAMRSWEVEHADQCVMSHDDGQFFGFTEVGHGYLGRYTRFVCVPAVRDAGEDASEGRGSPTTELLDMVVRNALARRDDLRQLKEETEKKYQEIVDPTKLIELAGLQSRLTTTLQTYVPEASVEVSWTSGEALVLPMPKANVRLTEDGYSCGVNRTGHGLQRAFILTLLQHLSVARALGDEASGEAESPGDVAAADAVPAPPSPDLVLAIEEPELYQHPNRQRHLARVLMDLASGGVAGVARRTQVIYCTHSPLFVDLQRFNHVRRLTKTIASPGKPRVTDVRSVSLDHVADRLWEASGRPEPRFTGETLRPRLQAIMTPWINEGFFADVVVLVEGEADRAALMGMAGALGHDFEANGISVLPCNSKNSLDRPYVIFRSLQIPSYLVWDSDLGNSEASSGTNRYLLRLAGCEEEDWPARVTDQVACFRTDTIEITREEIGAELFDQLTREAQEELGIAKRDQALKNPAALKLIIERAMARGCRCPTLESVVTNLAALRIRGEIR